MLTFARRWYYPGALAGHPELLPPYLTCVDQATVAEAALHAQEASQAAASAAMAAMYKTSRLSALLGLKPAPHEEIAIHGFVAHAKAMWRWMVTGAVAVVSWLLQLVGSQGLAPMMVAVDGNGSTNMLNGTSVASAAASVLSGNGSAANFDTLAQAKLMGNATPMEVEAHRAAVAGGCGMAAPLIMDVI